MATLESLKKELVGKFQSLTPTATIQGLTEEQYRTGFNILLQGPGWNTYERFIIPQLSQLVTTLCESRKKLSILEVGPGPKSVLGHLPEELRRMIKSYTAYEPKELFVASLKDWLEPASTVQSPFPGLEYPATIQQTFFVSNDGTDTSNGRSKYEEQKEYDLILFYHSMYGMASKTEVLQKALNMLKKSPHDGIVAVFHRHDVLSLGELHSSQTYPYTAGIVQVQADDDVLNNFASFIAGFTMVEETVREVVQKTWREICRKLGRYVKPHAYEFDAPDVMLTFTRVGAALPSLSAEVPMGSKEKKIKNWQARLRQPAAIVRPTTIEHVQECVRWALKYRVGLSVIGGSHSSQCIWSHVVAIDMADFNQIHIVGPIQTSEEHHSTADPVVFVGAGCQSGDIVKKTMEAGLTVPLGSRPSVGAGLWLQGGIGHLSRLYGLTCDAIMGAVIVSLKSARVLLVGFVPKDHRPAGAIRPCNERDLLWAIKGAGTNVGIVLGVTFKAFPAPMYFVQKKVVSLQDDMEAAHGIHDFDSCVAGKLESNYSADAYLYRNLEQLHLGVTLIEASASCSKEPSTQSEIPGAAWGLTDDFKLVDGVELFDTEAYIFDMHGGHGGGKTSSFKRCLFLTGIGNKEVTKRLVLAMRRAPSPMCYLHLLHGGGTVGDLSDRETAFGCRNWEFACVITGVWLRDQDGSELATKTFEWVYDVALDLMSLDDCRGAYCADLGPDPRDAPLAAKAFGPNSNHLAFLKRKFDPSNLLAYTCPLFEAPRRLRLIFLVTGKHGAGKDHCANVWASFFREKHPGNLRVHVASISDSNKKEFAKVVGADLSRLLEDREYKEQHRPAMNTFFQEQLRERPDLPQEHFVDLVQTFEDVDILFITGMKDKAPVATLSHLIPEGRLIEIYIQASDSLCQKRRGCVDHQDQGNGKAHAKVNVNMSDYSHCFTFSNETNGDEAINTFAAQNLVSLLSDDLQHLADMVRTVGDFPCTDIDFRHVLGIAQQRHGLALCNKMLESCFPSGGDSIDAIVSCEVGGLIFASALSERIDVPLVLIREAGKLPPPTISVEKPSSHITTRKGDTSYASPSMKSIEIEEDAIRNCNTVTIVDDVLATGETLSAVIRLLCKAGISTEQINVLVIAELPAHRGRELLTKQGYGRVHIRSLLVFSGA